MPIVRCNQSYKTNETSSFHASSCIATNAKRFVVSFLCAFCKYRETRPSRVAGIFMCDFQVNQTKTF